MAISKKISELELTTQLNGGDLFTIVQDGDNKKFTGDGLVANLSNTFATNTDILNVTNDLSGLEQKVDNNYDDLSNKIIVGDQTVTNNLNNTIVSYYDVLNNKIITLDIKHDKDINGINNTVQDWINEIDDKSSQAQLNIVINRLINAENIITALAELIANGGGSGVAPGFHTQPTNTIFPLTGYYKTYNTNSLTTTDTLNQALGKLESKIDAVSENSGTLPIIKYGEPTPPTDGNLYTAAKSREENLSRKNPDTAQGKITFLNGIQAGPAFTTGFLGVGSALYKDGSKWNFEVDNLFVRGSATFNELVVNEIKAIGGELLVTVADMECAKVVEYPEYYRCFLPAESSNQFQPLDQAICQKFDGTNVKRYWRLVIRTGTDPVDGAYIDLSKTDAEANSGVPEEGDAIIQLGNRNDESRRGAIMISAKGSEGPTIKFYDNITAYSLEDKEQTVIGRKSRFVGSLTQVDYNGNLIPVPIDKGMFITGQTYYYYDRVSYNGSLWICMAEMTTEAPDENKPYIWQLQVGKGEPGQAGDDVAKWVEIIGQRIFAYDNPEFTGTPNPESIVLDCNHYGIETPNYVWRIMDNSQVISTYKTCEITPNMLFGKRSIIVRCTITYNDVDYWDETQIIKLGNGATGEDAYYIDLSNGNMTVPYDSSGLTPLINLTKIYTHVYAYKGIDPIEITSLSANTVEGLATVDIDQTANKITLTSLSSETARIEILVNADGQTFKKDLWITQTKDGNDGFDGMDAAYVMVNGEQLFHYTKESPLLPNPENITLYATAYNIVAPEYTWYYRRTEETDWNLISGEIGESLLVSPAADYFILPKELAFKVECRPSGSSVIYFDIITVSKIYDGIDGASAYTATLSNESQTISASYSGSVLQTDINKTSTLFELYYGTDVVQDYSVRRIKEDASNTSEITPTSSSIIAGVGNKRINLSTMDPTKDSAVFVLEFLVGGVVVAVRRFTVTKAKGGKPGNFIVQLYAYKASGMNSRPSMGAIGVPTAVGVYDTNNAVTWFLDIPSGTPIWMTKADYTYNDNGTVTATPTDGSNYWTIPEKISGSDGAPGSPGSPGAPGKDGSEGPVGQTGPAQTYRGDWSSSSVYYLDQYRADVVSIPQYSGSTIIGRVYYRRVGPYVGTSTNPSSDSYRWTQYSSFTSVATGLLFAQDATISDFVFNDQIIRASSNRLVLNGNYSNDRVSGNPIIAAGNDAYLNGAINPNAALKIYGGGTLTVGEGDNQSNAGIAGGGTGGGSVRFWAGDTFANKEKAPFRVTQDGSVTMTKATIQSNPSGERLIISSSDRSLSFVDASDQVYGTFGFAPVSWPGGESQPKSPELRLGKVGDTRSYVSQFGFMVSNSKYSGSYGYQSMRISDNSSLFVSFGFNISTLAVQLSGLPTTAPAFGSGKVWRDGTTLKITV